jgi:hypothetical protein
MLPDPVSQAAQVFVIAMPKLARNAYRMALAVDECEDLAIGARKPCQPNTPSHVTDHKSLVQLSAVSRSKPAAAGSFSLRSSH